MLIHCSLSLFILISNTCPTDKIKYSYKIAKNICEYSREYNINPYLMVAVAKHESNFNPKALGGGIDRGLFQLNSTNRFKTTFDSWKKRKGCDLYDIKCNTKKAAKFLSYYKKKTRNKNYHYIRHYNWNNKKHAKYVLWLKKVYENPEKQKILLIKTGKYRKIKTNRLP